MVAVSLSEPTTAVKVDDTAPPPDPALSPIEPRLEPNYVVVVTETRHYLVNAKSEQDAVRLALIAPERLQPCGASFDVYAEDLDLTE